MNAEILKTIEKSKSLIITDDRKQVLQPLIGYIQEKVNQSETIRLNFICTHNSRRSHLSQIWAQTMAHYYNIPQVFCYSGGTQATAMFPKVAETLTKQGFTINKLAQQGNPVYAIKYDNNEAALICFSKEFDHNFNPKSKFGAIMTCDSADEACPTVFGADGRFPIKYEDPKAFDNTDLMDEKYEERSLQIASDLNYVFSSILIK